MKKSYIKYFTLLLTILLLNSNFSFAISEMMCKMSTDKDQCECTTDSHTGVMKITSEEKACCKNSVSELNNSNTLEKNNTKHVTDQAQQKLIYTMPVNKDTQTSSIFISFVNLKIPVPDIPIFNSSLLI
ncbi:MAG TPA: hypothetical protein PKA90_07560 [Ignavibacteria bacterium]|nr:hypothetical protein [Ignavibacteria bacterium]